MYMYIYMYTLTGVGIRVQFSGVILSFCHVGPEDETQGIRLGNKLLFPLSHITSPSLYYLQVAGHSFREE